MDKIGIVGGGASALMCASFIDCSKAVTIIEKNDKLGRKILATGNGRCNLSNAYMSNCSYNVNVIKFLDRFSQNQTLEFFNSIGLITYSDEEGRVYPISNSATSVLDVLRNNIKQNKTFKIINDKTVVNIEKRENKYKIIYSDESFDVFDKVVIASGNETNLSIFNGLNIKYNEFLPSLCALITEKHKNLNGVRVKNVEVKCKFSDHEFKEKGEVLFKDDGISGIVIFNLSAHMARTKSYNYLFNIDLLPDYSLEKIIEMLKDRKQKLSNYVIDDFLTGIFNKAINFELLKKCNIDTNKLVNKLKNEEIDKLANLIKCYELTSVGVSNNNQVCCGGIKLEELDDNLQSKNNKGLFFVGEVIDVDGVCGGYNLQWAWTSGKIVGESL